MTQDENTLEICFNNFKEEVELFFMTKFISGNALKSKYEHCLDVIYNVTGTKDVTRGIFASNPKYGQGKSFFFEVVNHRHRRKYGTNLFKITNARELCHIYTSCKQGQNPEELLLQFINCQRLFIDDIGDELKDGKERSHYSNKLNVIRFVLLKRYDLWIQKGWKTYGTTNLTIEQIGENYDGRVADRLLQMTYFEEFKFLGSGSFRQIEETRKLTPNEIQANKDLFKKEIKVERPDLEKFFNELMLEPDEFLKNKGIQFWAFVKDYFVEKNILTQKDFDAIDEQKLDSCESILRLETTRSIKAQSKHAPGNVRNNYLEEAISNISKSEIYDTAENMIARSKFFELKKQKHIFKK